MGSPNQLKTTVITLYVISCLMVILRCFVRTMIVKSFKYDDWLMVSTLAMYSFYSAFVLCGIHYGTGQHIQDLAQENAMTAKKFWYLCELTYILSTTLIKFAIAAFLLRIAVLRWHVRGLKIVMGAVGIFGVFYLFFGIFQCWPISKFWIPTDDGFCFSGTQIAMSSYAHSTISAAADWFCGILPIFMVRHITLSPRMKVIVIGILAIGSIGSIASLVRYAYIGSFEGDDFLFSTTDLAIWSTIEVGLGVIAGSVATFRPLLRIIFGKAFVSTSYNINGTSSQGTMPASNPYARTDNRNDLRKHASSSMTLENISPAPPIGDPNQTVKKKKMPFPIVRPLAIFQNGKL